MKPIVKNIFLVSLLCIFPLPSEGKNEDLSELKRVQEANNQTLAETTQSVNSMRQEIQELKGSVEETKHFYQEESLKNDTILKDFDLRLTAMEEKLSLYGNQIQEILAKPGATPQKKGEAEGEDSLYKRALTEVNLENYKGAGQLFDQFLKKYPKSSLSDNAQYWKGETLFALKDYPNAILEFDKVAKKYPKSNKVPGAILKQGYSFLELKSYNDAKVFFQKVISDYPASDEAAKAREKLQKIP